MHKYLTVSKEMLTKTPHRISEEFNKEKKKEKEIPHHKTLTPTETADAMCLNL